MSSTTHSPGQPNFNWNSKVHKYLGKICLVGSGECLEDTNHSMPPKRCIPMPPLSICGSTPAGLAASTGLYSRWGKTAFPDEKVRAGVALAILIPQLLVALELPSPAAVRGEAKRE